ncbi:MAG TPA: nucleoside deaminase [Melioribacteraceae bacterium]|nr:nucleoside deaminase [Melioribacteraceae bacterium]
MSFALDEANSAFSKDEIPVGAIIVKNDVIIGRGYNKVETNKNPLHHAEIIAIEQACLTISDKYLNNCDIYVTLEPCVMCIGAILNSRIQNLYFGAFQPKFGACGSMFNIPDLHKTNHFVNVYSGILEDESEKLLKEYFIKVRQINR